MNFRLLICLLLAVSLHALLLFGVTLPAPHPAPKIEPKSVPVDVDLVEAKPPDLPPPPLPEPTPEPVAPEPPPVEPAKEPALIEPPAPQPEPIKALEVKEPTVAPPEAEFPVAATTNQVAQLPLDIPPSPPVAIPPVPVAVVKATARYRYNPEPEYPLQARRRRHEGTVLLTVLLNTEGLPENIKVKQSSGFSLLDNAAVSAVQRWRFEPTKLDNQAVPSEVEIPIRFQLSK